jgi:integral membrane protein (TIGR01906 family)
MARLANIALGLLVAVWLACASFMIVLSPAVTHQLADAFVDTASSTLPHDYLVSVADAAREFSLGNDSAKLPVGEDERVAFTEATIRHLLDVRTVFLGAIAAFWTATVLFAAVAAFLAHKRKSGLLASALTMAPVVLLAACLVVALAGLLNFDALFGAMHGIFFEAGTWQFSYDSLLICSLPEPFWMGCAVVWALALVLLCLASIAAGALIRHHSRSKPR